MIKKGLIIFFAILLSLSLSACNKNETKKSENKTATLETIKGYTYLNPVTIKVNCILENESNKQLSIDLPKDQKIKIIDLYGSSGLTIETKVDGKNKQISCDMNEMIFPPELVAKIIPFVFQKKQWAINMARRVKQQMTSDEINTIFKSIVNTNTANFLTKYNFESELHRYNKDFCIDLLRICEVNYANAETTPFHMLAEVACYDFCDAIDLGTYSDYVNKKRQSILMSAILAENADAVRYFYEKKFFNTMKDNDGKTAADYASESNNQEIKMLCSALQIDLFVLQDKVIPVLNELQYTENFYSLGINTFDIPYTIYSRAQKENILVYTNTREEYFTEFSIQAEIASENDEPKSESDAINFAFVYSSDEEGNPDYSTKLKLRNSPSAEAKQIATLNYGDKVTILEHTEEPDIIGNISDYWYKVSFNNKEGWCFGGFLAVPVLKKDACKNDENTTWLIQVPFQENQTVTVCEDCYITSADNQKFELKPLDKIEILKQFRSPNDEEKPDMRNYHIAYDNIKNGYKDEYHTIYPFYLVRDSKNNFGVISGKYLAHYKTTCSLNYVYYISVKQRLSYFHSYYANVWEENLSNNNLCKLTFVNEQDDGQLIKDEYNTGVYYPETYNGMPNGPIVSDAFDLSEVKSNSKGRVIFFNNGYSDDWGKGNHFAAFTIDEYGFAIKALDCYQRTSGGYYSSGEFSSGVYPYVDKNKRLSVFEFYGSRYEDENGRYNEWCRETTYVYRGPKFEKTEEKDTDKLPTQWR